jgi:hypothetical protein
MQSLAERFLRVIVVQDFLKEGVNTYLMAPISVHNCPSFSHLQIFSLCWKERRLYQFTLFGLKSLIKPRSTL